MDARTADFNYRVALAPSRRGRAFVAVAGAATVALLVWLPLLPVPKMAAIAWVGIMWISALRKMRATAELVIRSDDDLDGSFVAPWLTIVRRHSRTTLVLPDMLDPARFRELRVLLRHQPPKPGTDHVFRGSNHLNRGQTTFFRGSADAP